MAVDTVDKDGVLMGGRVSEGCVVASFEVGGGGGIGFAVVEEAGDCESAAVTLAVLFCLGR